MMPNKAVESHVYGGQQAFDVLFCSGLLSHMAVTIL